MKEINVLYTTDSNYLKYMLVSLYSLLENNTNMKIVVHVICDKFEIEDYKRIEYLISLFSNANAYFYSFGEISQIVEEYNIPNWRGSKIANARLFFSNYIKDVDNLLYLDSDTIVVNSLSKLSDYNGTIHMAEDSMPKDYWQNLNKSLKKYCNSGVLWINVQKWQEKNCDDKIRYALQSNIAYTYPDQDLINVALRNEIQLLPLEYNLFSIDSYFNPIVLKRYYKIMNIEKYSFEQVVRAKRNPIILHSTPFYYFKSPEKVIHPYHKIYEEFAYKIFGEKNKESYLDYFNSLMFQLYLYSSLYCPKNIKNIVKKYLKR